MKHIINFLRSKSAWDLFFILIDILELIEYLLSNWPG